MRAQAAPSARTSKEPTYEEMTPSEDSHPSRAHDSQEEVPHVFFKIYELCARHADVSHCHQEGIRVTSKQKRSRSRRIESDDQTLESPGQGEIITVMNTCVDIAYSIKPLRPQRSTPRKKHEGELTRLKEKRFQSPASRLRISQILTVILHKSSTFYFRLTGSRMRAFADDTETAIPPDDAPQPRATSPFIATIPSKYPYSREPSVRGGPTHHTDQHRISSSATADVISSDDADDFASIPTVRPPSRHKQPGGPALSITHPRRGQALLSTTWALNSSLCYLSLLAVVQ